MMQSGQPERYHREQSYRQRNECPTLHAPEKRYRFKKPGQPNQPHEHWQQPQRPDLARAKKFSLQAVNQIGPWRIMRENPLIAVLHFRWKALAEFFHHAPLAVHVVLYRPLSRKSVPIKNARE